MASLVDQTKKLRSEKRIAKDPRAIKKEGSKEYLSSLKESLIGIQRTLDELDSKGGPSISLYKKVLRRSSQEVISKWSSGRKYCRTYFVRKAFGKLYPSEYFNFSLYIDGIVNILDDILDEPLDKEGKFNYMVELVRLFSIVNNQFLLKSVRKFLKSYFEKLIVLAVAEKFYQEKILKEDVEGIIRSSVDLFLYKARDFDIFIDIALLKCRAERLGSYTRELSRIFRGINILKKDIEDIEHDRKSGTYTLIGFIFDNKIVNFDLYVKEVLKIFSLKKDQIAQSLPYQSKRSLYFPVVCNFLKMIEEEKEKILGLLPP